MNTNTRTLNLQPPYGVLKVPFSCLCEEARRSNLSGYQRDCFTTFAMTRIRMVFSTTNSDFEKAIATPRIRTRISQQHRTKRHARIRQLADFPKCTPSHA